MGERRRPKRGMVSTGLSSFVLIFVMLSLMTFAVLSLVSAQADLRLSRKSAERTTAYYEAENAAGDVLTDLLLAAREGPEELAARAAAADVTLTEDGTAVYQVPLGDDQVLAVEVEISPGGTEWEIRRWQTVSQYDWDDDEPMNVLGADGLPVLGGKEE